MRASRVLIGVLFAGLTLACGSDERPAEPAVAPAVGPELYKVGDEIEPLTLNDQHGNEHSVDASIRLVIFSRTKDGSDVVKGALRGWNDDSLAEHDIVNVGDIHTIPSAIRRGFVIPAMRKGSSPILLDQEGDLTSRFPAEEGAATLIFVDDLRIERLLFTTSFLEARKHVEAVAEAKTSEEEPSQKSIPPDGGALD